MRAFCGAVCIVVGVVAFQPAARAQDTDAAGAASPDAFARLLQDRYDAARADYREFLERTTGDPHVSVLEAGDLQRLAKAQVVAALLKNPGGVPPMPAGVRFGQTVREVTVQRHGNTAVVQYRRVMQMVFNDEPVRKEFRCTEVFTREGDAWQSIAYQETVIPGEITPAPVDPKVFDDYVGAYEVFTGHVYSIRRAGNTLLLKSAGRGREQELMPETDRSFVIRGSLYRVIFVRDGRGKVTHLRVREFPGVEYNARRVE